MRRHPLFALAALAFLLTGCPGPTPPMLDGGPGDDGGTPPVDAHVDDAQVPPDAEVIDGGTDGGTDAGVLDGGTPTGTSDPAPPAEIVRAGTGGFLLRGAAVLAPTGPIVPGEVLIVGNTITCVAADCSTAPMADTVTVIDTHATIAPGLIDGHNHATYDFLPEWIPDPMRLFGDRYDWRGDSEYSAWVRPESAGGNAGTFVCPATKWAELRSIVHGTTTIQGQSPEQACANRLARNADHYTGVGGDLMQTTISGACESGLSDSARATIVTNFTSGATTRLAVHMSEGVTGDGTTTTDVTHEFECYAGTERYTTSLLYGAGGAPYGTAVFIHGAGLDASELDASIEAGAHFVWSPSSNILLYGGTTDIARLIDMNAVVGLGPDWTVSGSDEMLSELRFALEWATAEGIAQVTPSRLVRMATQDGARAVGMDAHVGRLAPGLRADLAVFGRVAADPYRAVVDSYAADVRLTMIDGAAYYGDLALETATAVNGDCDALDACGTPKFLCSANTPGAASRASETVDQVREQLRAHLAAGWDHDSNAGTPNQPFVLGPDDLLELVDCSL